MGFAESGQRVGGPGFTPNHCVALRLRARRFQCFVAGRMRPKLPLLPKQERLAVPVKHDLADLDLFWEIVSVLVRLVSGDLRFLHGNRERLDSFKEAITFRDSSHRLPSDFWVHGVQEISRGKKRCIFFPDVDVWRACASRFGMPSQLSKRIGRLVGHALRLCDKPVKIRVPSGSEPYYLRLCSGSAGTLGMGGRRTKSRSYSRWSVMGPLSCFSARTKRAAILARSSEVTAQISLIRPARIPSER